METKCDYQAEVYMPQLEEALEFQDFVCLELHKRGIVLQNTTSQRYQWKTENLLGMEIKLDKKFQETGRLYIETAEKAHPNNKDFIPSGIYRDDDTWLFGIGDRKVFFVFSKKVLQRLDRHNPKWLFRPQPTATSKAFCIPVDKAHRIAERVFNFTENDTGGAKG